MIRRFLSDFRGAAMVELALVAPVVAGLVLVSYGVWDAAARRQDMRAGLDAAAGYYMNGGADDAVARSVATNAWESRPTGGAVTSSRSCRCGGTPGTCDALCTGSKAPSVFVNLTATGSTTGALFAATLVEERTVRVR